MKKHFMLYWLLLAGVTLTLAFSACKKDDIQPVPGIELKAIFNSLDWGDDSCFVVGHKVPDVDAVTSAMSYAYLMRSLGYPCEAVINGDPNRETEYISRIFNITLPQKKTSVEPLTRLILTDHTDYAQCLDGARNAVILQKIDHHIEGDIADAGIPYVRREMVGSTNTIIYEMYRELDVPITDQIARIMLAGILSDTRNLSKSTTCAIDSTAWQALTAQLGISADSAARLNRAMENTAYDYSGMTDVEIFLSDYKDYEIGSHLIGIGSMGCRSQEMDAFLNRMLAVMPEVKVLMGREMLFAKTDVLTDDGTDGMYILYHGEGARELMEAIFGTSLRDGVIFVPESISRKVIVKRITEILTQE